MSQIFQFLATRLDPNVRAFGKVEDEVPLLFKRLNYPFQISKSALFAVGSPHRWVGCQSPAESSASTLFGRRASTRCSG